MSYAFTNPTDIVNRAMQHCGVRRIGTLNDQNAQALELNFLYDKLRLDELERNLWTFSVRRTAVRAIDLSTQIIVFPLWASGTTYARGAVVQYPSNSGVYWISNQDSNTANTPGTWNVSGVQTILAWDQYFGPLTCDLWNWNSAAGSTNSSNASYYKGELVYMVPTVPDGTFTLYQATLDNTTNQPNVVDAWLNTILYASGAVVSYSGTNYQSEIGMNLNNTPVNGTIWTTTVTQPAVSGSWQTITAPTLKYLPISYPLDSGPFSDSSTYNAFRLPAGYVRSAPQAPKRGAYRYLGAPSRMPPDDYERDGDYITSSFATAVIPLRFGADVRDVTLMNAMFCEGLACRIALEVGPRVTQDFATRVRVIETQYKRLMYEARIANAIEQGPVEQVEDSYITSRV